MKKNLEYYQHFTNSHNHPKFKMLRSKYGWEGEGRYWALNNMIAQADDCLLDLDKNYNKAMIAVDLNMSIEELESFVSFLVEDCNLIYKIDNKITTEIINENYSKVQAK